MLRCHTRSLKRKIQNLLISNSVAGAKLPYSELDNINVHPLLIPGNISTPELPKRISLASSEKVDHEFVQTEFDQGLSSSKVMRVPVKLGYTRALTRKGMKHQ